MPLIAEDCLRRIQESSDIVAVAESYGLKLKRAGSSFLALCPFHNEKTASFNINPQLQIFKCFGCGVAGGVLKFVQLMERCEFPEAAELLAQRNGIELQYEGGAAGANIGERSDTLKALRWANRIALDYFRRALRDNNEGRVAREYLLGRGFTPEIIEAWGLGWSPDSWDGLMQFYTREVVNLGGEHKKDKAIEVGLEAGIFRHNEDKNRTYDAFRGRVMFPIFDNQQRPIGFGGRVLEEKPEAGGKYLNTSETPLFKKRSLLFGLNFAAKEIGLTKTAIVVEGYTDTIMCHQYGVRNVVATLGTSLTHEHVGLLRRYIHNDGRVVALFDSDNAGIKATERAIEIFMEEGVTLQVLQNLEVKDAGEYLPKFGGEAFRKFLEGAKDSFAYILEKYLKKNFGTDVGGKASAVEKVMELVNRCPNPIRREMMRRKVAEVAGVAEETLPLPNVKPVGGISGGSGFSPKTGTNDKEFYRSSSKDGSFGKRKQANSVKNIPAAPLIVDPRREGRLRMERRLLHYMLADKSWCEQVVDRYPPDEWHDNGAHGAAELLRDGWAGGEPPRLGDIMLQVTDEEVRQLLIDLVRSGDGIAGATAATEIDLNSEELQALLERIGSEDISAELEDIKQQLKILDSSDTEAESRLLQREVELKRKLRNLQ